MHLHYLRKIQYHTELSNNPFSFLAQVCDCDLLILNILAKYPGSTHDAFIWKASAVREEMKVATNAWLLGKYTNI